MPRLNPLPADRSIVSVKPILLDAAHRIEGLPVRITAPASGADLPIVLFSHGFGSDLDAYSPLVDHWAAGGFVVIQPTHLDSKRYDLDADDPRRGDVWRLRVEDMTRILDNLDRLIAAVPGLAGRVSPDRVVAAGHSFGGQTAGILVGLRVTDPRTGRVDDLADDRVGASIQLATAGRGGPELTAFARAHLPWLRHQDFSAITAPGLVVTGDHDDLPLSTRGPEWTADPYVLRGGEASLLTVYGGEHFLGGISGHGSAETTDESDVRVALVQSVTSAFLRHTTGVDETQWETVKSLLATGRGQAGRLETK